MPTPRIPEDNANPLKTNPIQGRSRKTMDDLLDTAAHFIEHDQDEHLTTNHIAERAGFSIGTLYRYFPNKEAILLALARRNTDRLIAQTEAANRRALAAGKTAHDIVRDNIHTMLELYGRGPRRKRWLARLLWRLESPAIAAAYAERSAQHVADLMTTLNDPELCAPTPALLFVATRALQGVIRATALENSPILDDPDFENELVRMYWNLLRKDPAANARHP